MAFIVATNTHGPISIYVSTMLSFDGNRKEPDKMGYLLFKQDIAVTEYSVHSTLTNSLPTYSLKVIHHPLFFCKT